MNNEELQQHIFYHLDNSTHINIEVEKNSRGMNYKITVVNASSVDEALNIAKDAINKLRAEYGELG